MQWFFAHGDFVSAADIIDVVKVFGPRYCIKLLDVDMHLAQIQFEEKFDAIDFAPESKTVVEGLEFIAPDPEADRRREAFFEALGLPAYVI